MEEKQTLQVPCISGIIDLQKIVQQQKLHFSEETNQYLVYQTLKKVGPDEAQKLISKLVERGDIEWQSDQTFEVENILDHHKEDGASYYLIKWKGWSNIHNSWEPQCNLNCGDMIADFHLANQNTGNKIKKRRPLMMDEEERLKCKKKRRFDELFAQLVRTPLRESITPLHLLSLSSPTKFKPLMYKGLVTNIDKKLPKFTIAPNYSSKRTKSYKLKKEEIQNALKEWEQKLNSISIDPAPIRVENDVDLEGPPENFEYIVDYKPGEGIEIPQDPLVGCECLDCIHNKKGCCPAACGAEFAYYKHKRVRVPKGSPIYECNKRCLCGRECPNRVVQQGRKHKVSIFRTSNGRGWGVKALQKIKSGTFVMEYVGEVITNEEAERRGKVYDAECRTYLFDLDYNDGDCPFTVDAGYYGNVSHFVNHSCDPNMEVYGVWINTLDPRLPRIALFAQRDIQKEEELTFDYMMTGDTTLQTASQVSGTELSPGTFLQEGNVDKKFPISPRMELKKACMSRRDSVLPSTETTSLSSTTNSVKSINRESPISDQSPQKHLSCSPKSPKNDLPSSVSSPQKQSPCSPKSPQKQTICSPTKSPHKRNICSPTKSPHKRNIFTPAKSTEKQSLPASDSLGQITSDVSPTPDSSVTSAQSKSEEPIPIQQQYRIVCQCGAANCRKYLF